MTSEANTTKVLVLGADGMLGNAILRYLGDLGGLEVAGTSRQANSDRYYFDAEQFSMPIFEKIIDEFEPEYVVNCIGYIRPESESLAELDKSIRINSAFPQKLSTACIEKGIRLVHFSTDCVFSGTAGPYSESDLPDEKGCYGISKFLGEVRQAPNITIRTSIIGRELGTTRNLLDWFLASEQSELDGYAGVLWNGITTLVAAKIVGRIISQKIIFEKPLMQIASETVSKYDLLNIFKKAYGKDVLIKENGSIVSDKTLIASSVQKIYFQDLVEPLEKQVADLKKFYE